MGCPYAAHMWPICFGRSCDKVVDCFSRHPVDDPSPDDSQEDDEAAAYVRAMLLGTHTDGATGDHILSLLDPHLTRLRAEANSDDKYNRLCTTVQQGFPTNKRQLDAATAPFYGLRQDLWVTDDLVLYGSRVIIPASLRREVLHGLHASRQGQDRTLRRARQVVYWPGITSDIQNIIRSCPACAEQLPSHEPEPLLSDPLRPDCSRTLPLTCSTTLAAPSSSTQTATPVGPQLAPPVARKPHRTSSTF